MKKHLVNIGGLLETAGVDADTRASLLPLFETVLTESETAIDVIKAERDEAIAGRDTAVNTLKELIESANMLSVGVDYEDLADQLAERCVSLQEQVTTAAEYTDKALTEMEQRYVSEVEQVKAFRKYGPVIRRFFADMSDAFVGDETGLAESILVPKSESTETILKLQAELKAAQDALTESVAKTEASETALAAVKKERDMMVRETILTEAVAGLSSVKAERVRNGVKSFIGTNDEFKSFLTEAVSLVKGKGTTDTDVAGKPEPTAVNKPPVSRHTHLLEAFK